MTTISANQLRTQWASWMKRVAKGERVTVTYRGKPVATMGPPEPVTVPDSNVAETSVKEMLAYRDRQNLTLGPDLTIKQLISEGRRY